MSDARRCSSVVAGLNKSEQHVEYANLWKCPYCKVILNRCEKLEHCKAVAHKDKQQIRCTDGAFKIISCFEDKIVIYRLINQDLANLQLNQISNAKMKMAQLILRHYVERHTSIAFQLEAYTKYTKDSIEDGITEGTFYVNHRTRDHGIRQ